jgi:tRNA modification GTPase
VFLARTRHLSALARAREHLETAASLVGVQADLVAEELRYSREALGEILGRKSADALLGDIFSRFCIGK